MNAAQATTLTDRDRTILAIESKVWRWSGRKEQAIRDELDMSATGYYLALSRMLDREDVLAADPILVRRLRAVRAGRRTTSAGRSRE